MKRLPYALLLGALVPLLPGCGSSKLVTISVTCTTRVLPSGLIEAHTSVHNSTAFNRPAVIYGPALRQARYVRPVLRTEEVAVRVGQSRQTYPGWIIPRVPPDKAAEVVFRVAKPVTPVSIVAHEMDTVPDPAGGGLTTYVVKAESWKDLKNEGCTVG